MNKLSEAAQVVVGACWSYLELLGIPIGCEHCEVETPKNGYLKKQAERINTALDKDFVPKSLAKNMAEVLERHAKEEHDCSPDHCSGWESHLTDYELKALTDYRKRFPKGVV